MISLFASFKLLSLGTLESQSIILIWSKLFIFIMNNTHPSMISIIMHLHLIFSW